MATMDGEIEPEELAARIEDEERPRIVDIRQREAFRRGHVPGSENVPLARLVEDVETFQGSDHVVTVCPHGKASVKAARLVAAYDGFEGRVESLRGGLEAWDGPIEGADADAAGEAGDGASEESTAPF